MDIRDKLLDWMRKSFTEGGEGTAPLRPKAVGGKKKYKFGKMTSEKKKKIMDAHAKFKGSKYTHPKLPPGKSVGFKLKYKHINIDTSPKYSGEGNPMPMQKSMDALSDWLSKAKKKGN